MDLTSPNLNILDLDVYTEDTYNHNMTDTEYFAIKIRLKPYEKINVGKVGGDILAIVANDENGNNLQGIDNSYNNYEKVNSFISGYRKKLLSVNYDGIISEHIPDNMYTGNANMEIINNTLIERIYYLEIINRNEYNGADKQPYTIDIFINKEQDISPVITRDMKGSELSFSDMDNNLIESHKKNKLAHDFIYKYTNDLIKPKRISDSTNTTAKIDCDDNDTTVDYIEYSENSNIDLYISIFHYNKYNKPIQYVTNSNITSNFSYGNGGTEHSIIDTIYFSNISGNLYIPNYKHKVEWDNLKIYGSVISNYSILANNFSGIAVGGGVNKILNTNEMSITPNSNYMQDYANTYKSAKCTIIGETNGDNTDKKIFYFTNSSTIYGSGSLVVRNKNIDEEVIIKIDFSISTGNETESTPSPVIRSFNSEVVYNNMPVPTISMTPVPNDPDNLNGINSTTSGIYGVYFNIAGEAGENYIYSWTFDYNSVSTTENKNNHYNGSSSSSTSGSSSSSSSGGYS